MTVGSLLNLHRLPRPADPSFAPLAELLTPAGWRELADDFPDASLFAPHSGVDFVGPGEPWQLLLLDLADRPDPRRGRVSSASLPEVWQALLVELATDEGYRVLVAGCAGTDRFRTRYSWHLRGAGSSAPPHIDAQQKLATHIFYFMDPNGWDLAWGGETAFLGGLATGVSAPPPMGAFSECRSAPFLGNRSLLFRNTPDRWHSVRPLRCPPGVLRRTFNVIVETEPTG